MKEMIPLYVELIEHDDFDLEKVPIDIRSDVKIAWEEKQKEFEHALL